ncbi:MAG: DUF1007 family protein, partial [Pseudomonadota bacterium]
MAAAAITGLVATQANAHPHVFIDGGIDFAFAEDAVLESIAVTWRFDEFETLYMLSAHGVSLNQQGEIDPSDSAVLARELGAWPDDYEGTAHLSTEDGAIALELPADLKVAVTDGQLEMSFTRRLVAPQVLSGQTIDVGFYEGTYYYALSITDAPQILGAGADCEATVRPFEDDPQLTVLQTTLFEL